MREPTSRRYHNRYNFDDHQRMRLERWRRRFRWALLGLALVGLVLLIGGLVA